MCIGVGGTPVLAPLGHSGPGAGGCKEGGGGCSRAQPGAAALRGHESVRLTAKARHQQHDLPDVCAVRVRGTIKKFSDGGRGQLAARADQDPRLPGSARLCPVQPPSDSSLPGRSAEHGTGTSDIPAPTSFPPRWRRARRTTPQKRPQYTAAFQTLTPLMVSCHVRIVQYSHEQRKQSSRGTDARTMET